MDEEEADLELLKALCWGARIILSRGKFDLHVPDDFVSLKEPRLADVISVEGVLGTLVDPRRSVLTLFTSGEFSVLVYVFEGSARFV